MANAHEILNRIKSIRDTMKITKAMYMVSSMKVQKAKKKLAETLPFFDGLQKQIREVLLHFPEMHHLYFDNRIEDERELVKRKIYIVITGDKGMAGPYNLNVIKAAREKFSEDEDYRIYCVGETGRHVFMAEKLPVSVDFRMSSNNPSIHRARVMCEMLTDKYKNEEVDEIHVIYTRMRNSVTSEVRTEQLLPLRTSRFLTDQVKKAAQGEIVDASEMEIFPSPEDVLETLVRNIITGFLYGAMVESQASEESARMMSMKTATDNADAMLSELSRQYNQFRQAAITQEITEVVGGAKALQKKKAKKKAKAVAEEA
ncbi:MAG: ATP synthase F1 subunit gamma [Lachnospiraceae bacterium]|nr:ATP synthase F1 subunit gamma [Lachnospiraceae bacterium]